MISYVFVETKTDDLDVINFPGFKFIMKNRKNIAYRRSGEIMVGYKDTLVNMIEIKETSCKYVLWFKCKRGGGIQTRPTGNFCCSLYTS